MEHSANYCSMSHCAIKESSDHSADRKLQLIKAIGHFYHANSDSISQVSANLKNAVKRANKPALSNHLTQTCYSATFLP
ncbi:MAG: hypothetical protein K2N35_11395 [Muribaculaceae bacterium]|nr:hypothetical protein [Muribaculaceae bacterium]